ncbi:odorant-binding protein 2b-like [Dipodomys merriami]|uniref:odorant-binding protein 2b-like n=1 Tax=Dipodomys merriami TaxID=94247 RepID=UPI00384D6D31
MKTLLLTAVLLGLVAALQAQEPLSVLSEAQNLAGTWYIKAMVTQTKLKEEKKTAPVFPVTMVALEGGDLEINLTIMFEGRCHDLTFQMQKTDEPGKYIDVMSKNVMYVENLPGKDHAIFRCEGQHQGEKFHVAKLMGPQVTPGLSESPPQTSWSAVGPLHFALTLSAGQWPGPPVSSWRQSCVPTAPLLSSPPQPAGKTPEPNAEALEEFQRFAQRKGFQEENIFMPKRKETCVSE